MNLALLLVLVVVGMLSGKNSVFGRKTESGGDSTSSSRVSANCRGLWLVICVESGLLGSEEKGSTLIPNRPPVRCIDRHRACKSRWMSISTFIYFLKKMLYCRPYRCRPLLPPRHGPSHPQRSGHLRWPCVVRVLPPPRCCADLPAKPEQHMDRVGEWSE